MLLDAFIRIALYLSVVLSNRIMGSKPNFLSVVAIYYSHDIAVKHDQKRNKSSGLRFPVVPIGAFCRENQMKNGKKKKKKKKKNEMNLIKLISFQIFAYGSVVS